MRAPFEAGAARRGVFFLARTCGFGAAFFPEAARRSVFAEAADFADASGFAEAEGLADAAGRDFFTGLDRLRAGLAFFLAAEALTDFRPTDFLGDISEVYHQCRA